MDGLLGFFEQQFKKGEPYRETIRGLLRGDTSGWNKLNAPTAVSPQEAVDAGMSFAPMGILSTKQTQLLNTLNPTGGLYVDYTPNIRASQPLGENLVPINQTMGGNPDDIITIYRGAPKNQKKIVPGDFITDMIEVAKSYTGDNNVLSLRVRKGDVIDDITEPLGNEYIYRPNADTNRLGTKKKNK